MIRMTSGQLMATMKYLGYVTHLEDGTPNPIAEAVCAELEGRAIESVMLSTWIAQAWTKHQRLGKDSNAPAATD